MRSYAVRVSVLFAVASMLIGCDNKEKTLFHALDPKHTGIEFVNTITETDTFNILTYDYIYNGGGVGVADFNNDGRQDLFFSGNQVPNKLYLNQGDMKFKDVTTEANVNMPGKWNSGVVVVDINNDGLMDVYICATTNPQPEARRNMLFINQGVNATGVPVFAEKATEYNVDFNGHSVMAAFLDYDHDGDLDLYILVNEKDHNMPTAWRPKIVDGTAPNNDRLLRNDSGKFTDVTLDAHITEEGYGLGLAVCDFNNDGWPDLYVSNDYMSNDILYLNQRDGTFKNVTSQMMGHQSQFSMGNDAADINNDGLSDLITVDMLPETNERKKTTIGNKSYSNTINNERFNYEFQYVRNMLQVNNGLDKGIRFSEIGQLSGVYQTEWSWAPLFADFDNDGYKDLFITNGFPKDITDKDFANYRSTVINFASAKHLVDSIPVIKIPSYAFHNNGDLTFTDVSKEWGIDIPSFSNGAAFVDLDNDGDLDYVVNNINSPAFVFENSLYHKDQKTPAANHYFRVQLKGPEHNRSGLGAKLRLYANNGKLQYHDHSLYRGYMSSVEGIVHFGLGATAKIDSLIITWPDGKEERLVNPAPDQVYAANYSASRPAVRHVAPVPTPSFVDASKTTNLLFKHPQADVIDFNIQRTIPHKYSQYGPALAVGDINGDGLDDLFIGGPTEVQGTFYMQEKNARFIKAADRLKDDQRKIGEDAGVLLFDCDNDNDLDLYIVGGGFEWDKGDAHYQHKLYKNDGKGFFTLDKAALPMITTSGSCVKAADFDGDGDLDLFVGGRVVPWQYPYTPESFLLQNDHGKFKDATEKLAPDLKSLGMITDALWTDFDNDGKIDIMTAGELMPVTFMKNTGNGFSVLKTDSTIAKSKGWWNSITSADFDHDGDIDYVVGNLGQNNFYHVSTERPLTVIAKDLDNNGSVDAITGCYVRMQDGSVQLCPVHFWDELNGQSPRFRRQFSKYKKFSTTTMMQLIKEKDMEGAVVMEANNGNTSYIENLGNGKFRMTALPLETQFAPVFGMVSYDYDGDGNEDVLMVGNDFGNEVFSGRYDAFNGLVLKGDGAGGFSTVKASDSRFYVPGDAKALVRVATGDGKNIFVASRNKDSLRVLSSARPKIKTVKLSQADRYAELVYSSGKKERVEFYFGDGFLSQSSRTLEIGENVSAVTIYDEKGNPRKP